MSDHDPIAKAAAQAVHDIDCGCWEGSPKGTPLPGLLNPEDVEDRTDPEFFSQGYEIGCVVDEPDQWEGWATRLLVTIRPLIGERIAQAIEALGHHCDCDAYAPLHEGNPRDPCARATGLPCSCGVDDAAAIARRGGA